MSEDERIGSSASALDRAQRDTFANRRLAHFAGWTADEYERFLETGVPPRHDEREPRPKRSGPVY